MKRSNCLALALTLIGGTALSVNYSYFAMPTQLNRPIASLQINSAHRSKLMKNGYSTAADIQAVSVEELARDLGISLEDANAISAVAQTQPKFPPISTQTLWSS
ncbi:hypothetical protein RHS01_00474 [Rhizoctonia solani]|uniref:Uncharacterized protein n=1 Tax=Rhizoctonia solani TaxID=456999 RepID=A0A8H7M5T8_9AGAM|nr:hypothetical protein RHS01_00474 [Rhizoctonia solani]